jgi:hypothetical protein
LRASVVEELGMLAPGPRVTDQQRHVRYSSGDDSHALETWSTSTYLVVEWENVLARCQQRIEGGVAQAMTNPVFQAVTAWGKGGQIAGNLGLGNRAGRFRPFTHSSQNFFGSSK